MRTQITCPNCQTPYVAEVHQVIDAGQNPELKYRLLNGQLNIAVCPNCGAGGQLSTPLLFHDPDHELFMVHIPQEMNLDEVQREQIIGQLVRQVMDKLPAEQRRAYMLQPQMVLSMQTFMEKVLETEGITKEMIERQRRQSELLRTLSKADPDVVDHLIKEREDEIDETFFAMLQSVIDAASQLNDDRQLLPLINLRAKLMTETAVGRQLEKQQIALHKLNQEVKKTRRLTPEMLLKHVLQHEEDENTVMALVNAAQAGLDYEFFRLLSEEIEKREKAGDTPGAERLQNLRAKLLEFFETLQEQSRQLLLHAEKTLNELLAAENKDKMILERMPEFDEVFMYVLTSKISEAEHKGNKEESMALQDIHSRILRAAERQLPPEIQLLNDLLEAKSVEEQKQILESHKDMVSPELLKMVEAVQEQVKEMGQTELDGRLSGVKDLIQDNL
ncbi:MAG: hypothetical protein D6706_02880 [Chloroflexi bacterium]|nr:MAG: hypothetical protein D6706_02880 [Chloroflexota bacterium]